MGNEQSQENFEVEEDPKETYIAGPPCIGKPMLLVELDDIMDLASRSNEEEPLPTCPSYEAPKAAGEENADDILICAVKEGGAWVAFRLDEHRALARCPALPEILGTLELLGEESTGRFYAARGTTPRVLRCFLAYVHADNVALHLEDLAPLRAFARRHRYPALAGDAAGLLCRSVTAGGFCAALLAAGRDLELVQALVAELPRLRGVAGRAGAPRPGGGGDAGGGHAALVLAPEFLRLRLVPHLALLLQAGPGGGLDVSERLLRTRCAQWLAAQRRLGPGAGDWARGPLLAFWLEARAAQRAGGCRCVPRPLFAVREEEEGGSAAPSPASTPPRPSWGVPGAKGRSPRSPAPTPPRPSWGVPGMKGCSPRSPGPAPAVGCGQWSPLFSN